MIERRKLVAAAKKGEAEVLVTLVHVEGSSRRKAGARLLTGGAANDAYTGTISGGDLEAEAVRTAAGMVGGGAVVQSYATLCDDAAEMPYGVGGGGTVDLLYEPAKTPEFNALMFAMRGSLFGESYTVITWLPSEGQHFARAVIAADGSLEFATPGLSPLTVGIALVKGSSRDAGAGSIHVERIDPPQRLIVFGAGDDARPLVQMAALMGWNVVVIDERPKFAQPERFPEAQRVILATCYDAAALGVVQLDAVVLMTHSYEQDREWLATILPIAPRYFSMPGAKHRSSLLVSEAAAMIDLSLEACCERIFAPVGLELSGEGPEAIALAVISEANARCTGTPSKLGRLSVTDISAQVRESVVPYFMQTQGPVSARQMN